MAGLYCRCGHVGNYKLIELLCLVTVKMEDLIDKAIQEELEQKCNEHNTYDKQFVHTMEIVDIVKVIITMENLHKMILHQKLKCHYLVIISMTHVMILQCIYIVTAFENFRIMAH